MVHSFNEWLEESNKHIFSEEEREMLTNNAEAMPDGSFPIRNSQDLRDAIKSVGRAKDYEKAKAWIIKRARALKMNDLLPESWGVPKTEE